MEKGRLERNALFCSQKLSLEMKDIKRYLSIACYNRPSLLNIIKVELVAHWPRTMTFPSPLEFHFKFISYLIKPLH